MNLAQVKNLMQRSRVSRKGENGRLLIVGGCEDYVGALVLAGLAGLRAGCDSVTVVAPEKTAWAVNRYAPDLITKKLKGLVISQKHGSEVIRMTEYYDTVVLGVGMGTRDTTKKFIHKFIRHNKKPLIIDADGLAAVGLKEVYNSIITPNHNELVDLLLKANKQFLIEKIKTTPVKETASILQANLKYFLENNNILVVKGPADIVISRNKMFINRTGNATMAKAGTGDVLAGLIGGFLAKTKDPFKASCAGTYINGYVGDTLHKKKGNSFIASDLVEELKKAKKMK